MLLISDDEVEIGHDTVIYWRTDAPYKIEVDEDALVVDIAELVIVASITNIDGIFLVYSIILDISWYLNSKSIGNRPVNEPACGLLKLSKVTFRFVPELKDPKFIKSKRI